MSPSTFTTAVHFYPSPTPHTCAYEIGLPTAQNAFIFIGGLGDGPYTVLYPRAIAQELQKHPELSYSAFEFTMKSSFSGYGFSNLASDVAHIAALVQYLRRMGKQKVVLMGHSTGSQDIMEYASKGQQDAPVDGFILQGPASDRESLEMDMGSEALEESIKVASDMIHSGKGHARMPLENLPFGFDTPISASRWYALAAADGEDNYFSHDIPKDKAATFWQKFEKPLLILHSEEDEYVSKSIDKNALINGWKTLCRPGLASDLSGTIPKANHRVEQPDAERWLAETVVKFLDNI